MTELVTKLVRVVDDYKESVVEAALKRHFDQVNKGLTVLKLEALAMDAEVILDTVAFIREMMELKGMIEYEVHPQTDVLEWLEKEKREALRHVLQDGYRHNSTAVMDNVRNVSQFKAKQARVKMLDRLIKECELQGKARVA